MNKALFAELLELSPSERVEIAQDLWDSVLGSPQALPPPSEEQIAEARRRLEEHRRNPSSAIPWEEVRASLWARLK